MPPQPVVLITGLIVLVDHRLRQLLSQLLAFPLETVPQICLIRVVHHPEKVQDLALIHPNACQFVLADDITCSLIPAALSATSHSITSNCLTIHAIFSFHRARTEHTFCTQKGPPVTVSPSFVQSIVSEKSKKPERRCLLHLPDLALIIIAQESVTWCDML